MRFSLKLTNAWVLGLLACGPVGPGTPQGGSEESSGAAPAESTGQPGTTPSPTSGGDSSTSADTGIGTGIVGSTSASTGGSGSSGGADDGTFIIEPDHPEGPTCDVWAQDCPPAEKCVPYANDGGNSWNSLKCVPVMEDPAKPGEPCFVVDNGVSGIDNCDFGAYCFYVDPDTNEGECVAMCIGTPESPMCPDPENTYCALTSDGVINLCIDRCDPLEQDCSEGEVCIDTIGGEFLCVLDGSGDEGQLHDACEYANACDPGFMCVTDPDAAAMECDPAATGCCEPFCDATKPNMCPGMGQVCTPYFEEGQAPPGKEHIGVCTLPP